MCENHPFNGHYLPNQWFLFMFSIYLRYDWPITFGDLAMLLRQPIWPVVFNMSCVKRWHWRMIHLLRSRDSAAIDQYNLHDDRLPQYSISDPARTGQSVSMQSPLIWKILMWWGHHWSTTNCAPQINEYCTYVHWLLPLDVFSLFSLFPSQLNVCLQKCFYGRTILNYHLFLLP